MKHILVGTAGHIDHGKTTLIKALTGIDADRLKEEKERGITTDIGFAFLKWGDLLIHFVDLPGHEKFIKNMVAGASGINYFLLVIAADESVMPQSVEHIEIINYLGVKNGVAVITKCDIVDDKTIEIVEEETRELLKGNGFDNIPIFRVSSKTNYGIEELKAHLIEEGLKNEPKSISKPFRMWVDRSFSLKGFGTVITGTVRSGKITVGEEILFYPSNLKSVVRSIQVFKTPRSVGYSGERCALNVKDVTTDEVKRGDLVLKEGYLNPNNLFYAKVYLKKGTFKKNAEYEFLTGTTSTLCKIFKDEEGEEFIGMIKTNDPLSLSYQDRFLLRMPSPLRTIGGGEILFPALRKGKRQNSGMVEYLKRMDVESIIIAMLYEVAEWGITVDEICKKLNLFPNEAINFVKKLEDFEKVSFFEESGFVILKDKLELLKERFEKVILNKHKIPSLRIWVKKEEIFSHFRKMLTLRQIENVLKLLLTEERIVVDKEKIKSKKFSVNLNEKQMKKYSEIGKLVEKTPLHIVEKKDIIAILKEESNNLFQLFIEEKELLPFNKGEFFISKSGLEKIKEKLLDEKLSGNDNFKIAQFKEWFGLTRKEAIPLLEFLDEMKITKRRGDFREIVLGGTNED